VLANISLGTELRLDAYTEVPQGGQKLIDYENAWIRAERNSGLTQKLIVAWAWIFFALNTAMTMSMIYKIVYVSSFVPKCLTEQHGHLQIICNSLGVSHRLAQATAHLQHHDSSHHRVIPHILDWPACLCDRQDIQLRVRPLHCYQHCELPAQCIGINITC
jgi:hypothetical protein